MPDRAKVNNVLLNAEKGVKETEDNKIQAQASEDVS